MNTKDLTTASEGFYYPRIDEMIIKKGSELKERAQMDGNHLGEHNIPAPDAKSIEPNISIYKTACDSLVAEILQFLLPSSNYPEAKMEADHFKEKDKTLDDEIKQREEANRQANYKLGHSEARSILMKIAVIAIATVILSIGDVFYNTTSFLVTGENTLFALVLSCSFSFAVFVFSHVATFFYKSRKTFIQRGLVAFGTLFLVSSVFTGLASYRSIYMADHGVHINPASFVIFNLFLFLVSVLLSFSILPTWQEIGDNISRMKLVAEIAKRNKEIEKFKKDKEDIKKNLLEKAKSRIRNIHYANYTVKRVNKLYHEIVGIFISANSNSRNDKQTPVCFSNRISDLDINDHEVILSSATNTKTK